MGFQKQSYKQQALGNSGDIVNGFENKCVTWWGYTQDEVCVGCFIQSTDATNQQEVKAASGQPITGDILGVVTKTSYVSSCNTEATHLIPKNNNIEYLSEGAVFVENDGQQANKGQYVMLKKDNGKITFVDSINSQDYVYTGFRVLIGHAGTTDGIIAITTDKAYMIKQNQ